MDVISALTTVYYAAQMVKDVHGVYSWYRKARVPQDLHDLWKAAKTAQTVCSTVVKVATPAAAMMMARADKQKQLYEECVQSEMVIDIVFQDTPGKDDVVIVDSIPFEMTTEEKDAFVCVKET